MVCAILVASRLVLGIQRSGRAFLHPLEPNVPVPVPIPVPVPVPIRALVCMDGV
jgi:hypothetical protein